MLIDNVTIRVRAGNGGNGAVSFKRNKYTEKSAPSGGDGGAGGSIHFEGSPNVSDLREFRYIKKVHANDGANGAAKNHFGKNAPDVTKLLPFGTQITDTETGEVFEVTQEHPHVCIAVGGTGGRGNYSFRTYEDMLPEHAEKGQPGQSRIVRLELRLIAAIGLIGLPNAGKSSLLAVLTNAKPAIADYPFTTVEPNIGMMGTYPIADIPGLIEGASKGKGLGITFLKHIEKTTLLVHCIDLSGDDPMAAYGTVRKELAQYSGVLEQKQEIILLNKTDLVDAKRVAEYTAQFKKKKKIVVSCSIYDVDRIEALKETLERFLVSKMSAE